MATVCQLSYPLNSANASPFGTRTLYFAWPVSCAKTVRRPRTANIETANKSRTIPTVRILVLFIRLPVVDSLPATARHLDRDVDVAACGVEATPLKSPSRSPRLQAT